MGLRSARRPSRSSRRLAWRSARCSTGIRSACGSQMVSMFTESTSRPDAVLVLPDPTHPGTARLFPGPRGIVKGRWGDPPPSTRQWRWAGPPLPRVPRAQEGDVGVFDKMAEHGHEQVVFCFDRQTGMRAIIAIHDTALGPARGGTRYKAYASEEEALEDA